MANLDSNIATPQGSEERAINRAMHLLETRLRKPGEAFSSPNSIRKYLALNLAGYDIEVFSALWLDGQHRLIAAEHLSSGTLTQTSVYPREVVRRALAHNAASVIFAHNHPSGCADPSRDDLLLTQALKSSLALVDVRVLDHFIVAGENVASLWELNLLDATELPAAEKHAEQVIENNAKDSQKCAAKQKVKESEKIGFDILTVKAQIRAAFALLQDAEGYEDNNDLCDVGFSLIDASKKLDVIHDCVDAFVCA